MLLPQTFFLEWKGSVIFLGSPLIDVIVEIDDAFLQKYNLQPDNAYSINHTGQEIFEDLTLLNPSLRVGGSVTNTVRVFRKLTDLSQPVTYLGATGSDNYGSLVKKKLNEEEIEMKLVEIPNETTGKCAVLLRGKNRTLITDLGASRFFSLNNLTGDTWDSITKANCFYFSAFFINVSFEVIKKIVNFFVTNNKLVAINLGAPFLCQKYSKEMIFLYKNADLVFGNETEHRAFAKINNTNETDLVSSIRKSLSNSGATSPTAIITRGEKPVLAVTKTGFGEFPVNFVEKIRDTNGAGDVFVGGFLACYVSGGSIANCVETGIRTAEQAIQNVGCNFS